LRPCGFDVQLMNQKRQDMQWLVSNRSAIQQTALDLYDLLLEEGQNPPQKKTSFIQQDLVGAFFCLWRGVFLAHEKTSKFGTPLRHAKAYLTKIIDNNAISFNDDKNSMEWTANFYVDGAGRILAGFPSSTSSKATARCETIPPLWEIEKYPAQIKDRWKYNHEILKGKIHSLRKDLADPKSKMIK
jgi:hypothetical protein